MNVGATLPAPASVDSSRPAGALADLPEESRRSLSVHPVCPHPQSPPPRPCQACEPQLVWLEGACGCVRSCNEGGGSAVQATVRGTADTGHAAGVPLREPSAAHAAASAAGAAMAEAAARAEAAAVPPRATSAAGGGELAAERERNRMLTQRLGESQTALADLRSQLAEAKKAGAANGTNGKVCYSICLSLSHPYSTAPPPARWRHPGCAFEPHRLRASSYGLSFCIHTGTAGH